MSKTLFSSSTIVEVVPLASSPNEQFAFIVGYTSEGAPYGISWEEMDALNEENNIS